MTITNDKRFAAGFDLGVSLMTSKGQCPPTFIFEGSDGTPAIFPMGWNSEEERATVKRIVGAIAIATDAIAATMISETWMTSHSKRAAETEAEFAAREHVQPSKSSARREALTVAVATREPGKVSLHMVMREIERDAAGAFRGLADPDPDHDIADAKGWLSTCVPPTTVPKRARDLATKVLAEIGVRMEIVKPSED